jgi:hypothetical protein
MGKEVLRAVLDSNVFSAAHFDRLTDSPLRRLYKVGRVVPIYSAVMIEETLRSYASPKTRIDLLGSWLPFILETTPRLCDDLESIWHKELVQGCRSESAMYMRPSKYRSVVQELKHIPADGSWPVLRMAAIEIQSEWLRKKARRDNSLEMRAEVRKLAKEAGITKHVRHDVGLVSEERVRLMKMLGRSLIERFVSPNNWRSIANQWTRNTDSYPFFTQFVNNAIFQELLFITDHSVQVDANAQADLDILTCLIQADVVVTNESGFMRTAFEKIWRPRGKVMFTSDQFTEFLRRL